MDKVPHFSEIWMCNLTNKDGSIQTGYRPAFILSNDKNNTHSTTLNVIPITSKTTKKRLPIHVYLQKYKNYGLNAPSILLIEQITTISISHLEKYIGKVIDGETLDNINKAMLIQFPILSLPMK